MNATGSDRPAVRADLKERLMDYVAYSLTSAHGLYREPHSYGPMRMVDALDRSLALLKEAGLSEERLEPVLQVIRENRWKAGSDPEGFAEALDQAISRLVRVTAEA